MLRLCRLSALSKQVVLPESQTQRHLISRAQGARAQQSETLESRDVDMTEGDRSRGSLRLEKVLNARDLAEAHPSIKPGRLFRSGNPSHASLADVLRLRRDLGVRQLVDFRSSEERNEDSSWSLMLSNGIIRTYDVNGKVVEVAVDHNADLAGVSLQDVALHRLSLLERERFIRAMMWRLPWAKVGAALWYKLTWREDDMRDVLVPEINRRGLPLVYEILLDTAREDIRRTLELVATGAGARQPALIFCKLGKDRTGVVAALVLTACGVPEDAIVADYARSDGVHAIALGGLEKMRDVQGMDTEIFSTAPPEAMRALLAYARASWGGLPQYMESIGFSAAQQAALRRGLVEDEW